MCGICGFWTGTGEEPEALLQMISQFPNVAGASQVLHGSVTLRSAFKSESVRAYGIELAR